MTTQSDPAIERTIRTYGERLKAADIKGLVALFTEDGVLMQPDTPTAAGARQLIEAYTYGLAAMAVSPTFTFEQFLVDGDLASIRTRTSVAVRVHASGDEQTLHGREAFVLRRVGGEWKIAQYMFQHTAE